MSGLEEQETPQSLTPSREAVQRLLPMAGPTARNLPAAFVLLASMACVQVMLPQVMRLAIDGPLHPSNSTATAQKLIKLQELGILFLSLLAVGFAAQYLSTWLLQKFGQTLVLHLRQNLFQKLHRLPISYFDKHAVGRTVTRVVNDSNALSELFTSVLAAGLGDILKLAGILVVLLATDPVLSGILAAFLPALLGLVFWFRKRSAPLYKTQRRLTAQINSYFSELLDGLATAKSFRAEDFHKSRFGELNDQCLDNEIKLLTLVARFRPGFAVARMLATATLLTVGGLSVIDGSSTIGTLISSLLYIKLLFSPLEQLADRYNILIKATVASERVLYILDLEEETLSGEHLELREQTISFRQVSFHYSPDKPVLKDISFELAPGQSLALVGATGSGKSTIVSLLLGFYPIDHSAGHQGGVFIGETKLQELDLERWRSSLAFVSQDLFLFKGTIASNVTLFRETSPQTVTQALERAACQDFIANLPQGAETVVGEKGHALSTGQRQLLSFARALTYDPELLVLDEATANIDSETEQKIERVLDVLLEGRRAIIVAHRLSTVKRANKILVLENGRIAEQGNHSELMALDGLYAQMVRKAEHENRPRQAESA